MATVLPATAGAEAPPAASASAQVTTDELDRLVDTLQNDGARAKLVADLRALIAAQRGAAAEKPGAVTFFGQLSQQVDVLTGEILAGVAVVVDAPRLYGWARQQIADPAARGLWIEAAFAFVLVFGVAILAEAAVRWVLARLMPRLPTRRSDTRPVRALFAPRPHPRSAADPGLWHHRIHRRVGGAGTSDAHPDNAVG